MVSGEWRWDLLADGRSTANSNGMETEAAPEASAEEKRGAEDGSPEGHRGENAHHP